MDNHSKRLCGRAGMIIWFVISLLVAIGIFISSSIEGGDSNYASMGIAYSLQRVIPFSVETINFIVRKGTHFVVFFVLGFCVAYSLKFHVQKHLKLLLLAWGIAAVYGVLDEIHQYFVPGREMALLDMVINAVGAFLGAGVVVWVLKKRAMTIGKG